jgi:hypothetical protein
LRRHGLGRGGQENKVNFSGISLTFLGLGG